MIAWLVLGQQVPSPRPICSADALAAVLSTEAHAARSQPGVRLCPRCVCDHLPGRPQLLQGKLQQLEEALLAASVGGLAADGDESGGRVLAAVA